MGDLSSSKTRIFFCAKCGTPTRKNSISLGRMGRNTIEEDLARGFWREILSKKTWQGVSGEKCAKGSEAQRRKSYGVRSVHKAQAATWRSQSPKIYWGTVVFPGHESKSIRPVNPQACAQGRQMSSEG